MDLQIEAAIEQVRAGNVDAYARVVDTYERRLRVSLAGRCPPGVDADEIAHLAFVEAYRQIDRYRAGTEFYVWLWVIARNKLREEARKNMRRCVREKNVLDQLLATEMEREPAANGKEEEDDSYVAGLKDCLADISEDCARLLRLRYVESLSLQSISRSIGRTVSALKSQFFTIRKNLRECVRRKLALAGS
jgi:RNA polymerase sigma-70 factor (ECF subfamily)